MFKIQGILNQGDNQNTETLDYGDIKMRENINSGVSEKRKYLNYGDTQNARILKLEGYPKCKDS